MNPIKTKTSKIHSIKTQIQTLITSDMRTALHDDCRSIAFICERCFFLLFEYRHFILFNDTEIDRHLIIVDMVIRGCGGAYGVRCRLAAQNCHCRPICVLTAFNNGAWNRIAQLHSHYMFFFCVCDWEYWWWLLSEALWFLFCIEVWYWRLVNLVVVIRVVISSSNVTTYVVN